MTRDRYPWNCVLASHWHLKREAGNTFNRRRRIGNMAAACITIEMMVLASTRTGNVLMKD